jgi:hypothetical protein
MPNTTLIDTVISIISIALLGIHDISDLTNLTTIFERKRPPEVLYDV